VNAALVGEILGIALRHLQDPEVLARLGTTNAEANSQVFDLAIRGVAKQARPARRARAAVAS